ncbi:hypothetical protein [Bacteroides sp. An19]|uniref:hypothetical protein n=1 Tax=Bacteroides sp. An19 TaxID=1965580 RepID=UPI000B39A135|nr:hypothetical protein [Bacteroides sp. An19]OUP37236.1 hypothetical protein B5F25_00110 [Bacteroides sp. An19]
MERKIGEIFEVNGKWYQCVEANENDNCNACDLQGLCIRMQGKQHVGNCMNWRTDNKRTVYKKLEKVGEPYEYFVQHKGIVMLQPYKLFATPFINGVICNVNYDTNTIDLEIKQNKEDMEENYKAEDTLLTRLVGKYVNNLIDYETFEEAVKELYSYKKDSKLTLKEFNLEAAKQGKPVCTRDGRKARIICFDRKFYHDWYNYPIVAMVNNNDNELVHAYTQDGLLVGNKEGELDLMMLPEKKEGWVNVYYDNDASSHRGCRFIYDTKERAVKEAGSAYITTVKINWEE